MEARRGRLRQSGLAPPSSVSGLAAACLATVGEGLCGRRLDRHDVPKSLSSTAPMLRGQAMPSKPPPPAKARAEHLAKALQRNIARRKAAKKSEKK